MHFTAFSVFSDSALLVRQINGQYKVKQPHLQLLYREAVTEIAGLGAPFELTHVMRENNKEADALARKAVKLKSRIADDKIIPHGENGRPPVSI